MSEAESPKRTFTREEKIELSSAVYRALDAFERAIADAHDAGLHPEVAIIGKCPMKFQLILVETFAYDRQEVEKATNKSNQSQQQ